MSVFGLGVTLKAVDPTEEKLDGQKQFIVVAFEGYTLPLFQTALVSCLIRWEHLFSLTYFHCLQNFGLEFLSNLQLK